MTAVLCGILLGETDLVRAGVLAAAIPCAAAVVVHRSQLRVANRRSVEPRRAAAGNTVTVHLTITNRSLLPTGALMLEDQLPGRVTGRARFVVESLSSREARTVSYRIPDLGRGRYRVGPLRIRLGDPFRMIDLTRSFTATTDFLVTPRIDQLPSVLPPRSDDMGGTAGSHSVGSHGADDASTREYRTGDDLRKIHWRSSARTGVLMVRQEERPWRAHSTLLLDLRADAHVTSEEPSEPGAGDPTDDRLTSSLEWAVSAAASIGAQAMRGGRDLALIADTQQAHRLQFIDVEHLSTQLATVRASTTNDLTRIGEQIRSAARDSALVAILGRVGPNDLRLLADAHPRGKATPALALLLDVDSWASRPPDAPSNVEASAAVLRSAGWRVRVVRRGHTTAESWQLLLAGFAPSRSGVAVAR